MVPLRKRKVERSEEEWMEKLGPERFRVLRRKGTDPPFEGKLLDNDRDGTYSCAGCGTVLFDSKAKFDSGSGWPSFHEPVDEKKIDARTDLALILPRTEIQCERCGGHLGHVFNDGPDPTGKRFCVNSASLEFKERRRKDRSSDR